MVKGEQKRERERERERVNSAERVRVSKKNVRVSGKNLNGYIYTITFSNETFWLVLPNFSSQKVPNSCYAFSDECSFVTIAYKGHRFCYDF